MIGFLEAANGADDWFIISIFLMSTFLAQFSLCKLLMTVLILIKFPLGRAPLCTRGPPTPRRGRQLSYVNVGIMEANEDSQMRLQIFVMSPLRSRSRVFACTMITNNLLNITNTNDTVSLATALQEPTLWATFQWVCMGLQTINHELWINRRGVVGCCPRTIQYEELDSTQALASA